MNIDQTRSRNNLHEQNLVENYSFSSHEYLSSTQKCITPSYRHPPTTDSLSPHIPQRHSFNPVISDDSGNESSINYHLQSKLHPHFVVVAIDFGTTYSGYAFAFTRDVDSILMMRKVDGNDPGLCFLFCFNMNYKQFDE
jgi:hypothetical protein